MNHQADLESLRLAVYRAFARDGRAPQNRVLAQQLGTDPAGIEAGLRALATARHLVLDAEGRIVLAHPFASIPLGFSVMGARTLWWGGCAWDAFALPQLVVSEPGRPGRHPVPRVRQAAGVGCRPGWTPARPRDGPLPGPDGARLG